MSDATIRMDDNTIRLDTDKTIRIDENNSTIRLDNENSTIRMENFDNNSQEITKKRSTFLGYQIQDSDIAKKAGGEADIFVIDYNGKKAFVKFYRENIKVNEKILNKIKELSEKYDFFAKIYEIGKVENRIYEIQEYLEDGSLSEKLKQDKTKIQNNINEFIKRVSNALDILHSNKIIHRDLKPDNILFRGEEIVIGDFGISSILDDNLSKRLTSMRATIEYGAPEMAGDYTGQVYIGEEVDYWSLGIIILEIFNAHPFKGLNHVAITNLLATKPIPIPNNLSDDLQLLLKGLLTKDPKKRWNYIQIKEWLDGKTPEVFYEISSLDMEFKLKFNKNFYSIEELAKELLKKENFSKGIKYFDQGIWDGKLKSEANPYIDELFDLFKLETPEEKLIFFSYTILKENNKNIPFSLYGREITEEYIINLLQKFLANQVDDDTDQKIIKILQKNFKKLVIIYNEIYSTNILEFTKFFPSKLDKDSAHQFLNICANYFKNNKQLVKLLLKYLSLPDKCAIELFQDKELYEIIKNNSLNKESETYKKALIANGYVNEVKELIKSVTDEYLKIAFKYDQKEIIKYFLDLGSDLNIEFYDIDGEIRTPVLFAVLNQDIDLLNVLIQKGVDINKETSEGFFPLVQAVFINNQDILKLLLDNGADVNKIQSNGNINSLMKAVVKKNKEVVELLLKYKADPNIKSSSFDRTPLHEAVILKKVDIVELLLKHKADPNISDKSNALPLMDAVISGNKKIVELLLKYKADPNIKSGNFERTPLHEAVIRKNKDMIKILLKYNADINIPQKFGQTPLEHSITDKEIFKFLIKAGAKVDNKTYDIVKSMNDKELEKIMLSKTKLKTTFIKLFQILFVLIVTLSASYIFYYRYLLIHNYNRHYYTINKKVYSQIPYPMNKIIFDTLPLKIQNKLINKKVKK